MSLGTRENFFETCPLFTEPVPHLLPMPILSLAFFLSQRPLSYLNSRLLESSPVSEIFNTSVKNFINDTLRPDNGDGIELSDQRENVLVLPEGVKMKNLNINFYYAQVFSRYGKFGVHLCRFHFATGPPCTLYSSGVEENTERFLFHCPDFSDLHLEHNIIFLFFFEFLVLLL